MKFYRIWKSFLAFASLMLLLGILPYVNNAAALRDDKIVIVAFGDSLTAGYQLPPEAAFPVQLEKVLKADGQKVQVINSGVSGDTAADGLARFDWAMPEDADAVILELGANDSLRGIPVEETRKALSAILDKVAARKLSVLIAGMEAPRNWGEQYVEDFRKMYRDLAEQYGTQLYPFFLNGIALDASLNLGDGMHPNEKGVAEIVRRILPEVKQLLETVKTRQSKDN